MSGHVYRPGEPLNSKWTLDDVLGTGGMGTVFSASHRNGSRAALKLLHAEFATDLGLRERFLREGKIANRVDHPARVAVTDDDITDRGEPFLVMELLTGRTLSALQHSRGGKLTLEEALPIFDVVLDLLGCCHDVGIIHRDIKPANIFITTKGETKVLDFGVARMREAGTDATRAGTALGTPAYMAPEQALGQDNVDGRADVFSVGACLYFALSGEKVHKGQNETEAYLMAATRAAGSLASAAPNLPVEVVALVDRALTYDRNRRWSDARAMRTELVSISAALRAGTLGAAVAPRADALVVRGERLTTDDEEVEAKEDVDQIRERISGIWRAIGVLLGNIRQVGWTNPTTVKSLQTAHEELTSALTKGNGVVRWEVSGEAFTYEGVPVWSPDRAPLDRIPWTLFAAGIRQIQLTRGLTDEELRDFVAILLRDQGTGADEDDAVTALWDRRFEHVTYFAIDSFAEGDDDDRETFAREVGDLATKSAAVAMVDKDWDVGSLEARALQARLGAWMRETSEAAAAVALDPAAKKALADDFALTPDQWAERYADAFVEAWREGARGGDLEDLTAALRDWSRDQLALHAWAPAFKMLDTLAAAFARVADAKTSAALERKLRTSMFPGESLRLIFADLARDAAASVDPGLVEGLAKSLDALPDDSALALACECLASTFDDKLRNALFRYIKRFAAGQVATISGVLPTASPRVAIALVRLLADLKTPEALASLEKALRNPAVEVRVEALARSNEGPSERMREELARLFAEPNAEARAQALRVVGAAGLVAAGPIVALKLQEPTFHALPMAERKLWFECLAALNPRRADAIALEILVQKKLMPPKPVEETRVLAAEQLAKSRHRESLEALKKVAGDRWFTSQVVRDAAAKAATELEASMKAAAAKGAAKAPVKAPTKEAPKQAPKDATKEKP